MYGAVVILLNIFVYIESCPSKCVCSPRLIEGGGFVNGYVTNCSRAWLWSIPRDISEDTTELYISVYIYVCFILVFRILSMNLITSIHNDLRNLTKLEIL